MNTLRTRYFAVLSSITLIGMSSAIQAQSPYSDTATTAPMQDASVAPLRLVGGEDDPGYFQKDTTIEALKGEVGDQIKGKAKIEAVSTVGAWAAGKVLDPALARAELALRGRYQQLLNSGLTPEDARTVFKSEAEHIASQYKRGLLKKPTTITGKLGQAARKSFPVIEAPMQYAASKGKSKKVIAKGLGRRAVGQAGRGVLKAVGGKLLGPVSVVSDIYTIGDACVKGYQAFDARRGAKQSLKQAQRSRECLNEERRSRGGSANDRLRDLVEREREYFRGQGRGLPPSTQRLADSLD